MTASIPLSPVQQAERIQIVDILRGFALFGILLVNMIIFARPIQVVLFPIDPTAPWYDRAAEWFIHLAGEGKFYALFSLLFGLGLTLQMERIEGRGGRFVPLYARRLFVLLGIGIVHAFLIWVGDILIMYALLGFSLILFRKAKPRTLLIWVAILLLLPLLFNLVVTALLEWGRSIPEASSQIQASFAQTTALFEAELAQAYRVYANGNFAEITRQRIADYFSMGPAAFLVMGFNVLAMFLLGVYLGKQGIFRNLAAHRGLFQRLLVWGLVIGVSGNALYATLILNQSRIEPAWALFLATAGQSIGAPLLMLAYVSIFCLLALSPTWSERLRVLAPVGQMALTNYLTQSIVCTLIFYSYGLGLFGKVGAAAGIGLTLVIYLLQIPFSYWWMKRFYYGPAEWLWRSLTYLKPQPMKR
ncbi:MAG: DUF418 domain-containing protein [Anaerolineales bacterium]|nr:DUF418 domain-containing protein [Anaerolineales bacterium]MDW8448290.1 DUF418 domain-containing protein [Anaerolineales bacterium]